MSSQSADNPYQAPNLTVSQRLTARGYTPRQCFRRFFVIGLLGGGVGGAATSVLNSLQATIVLQLLPIGAAFALSLWVATGLFIARLSVGKMALLVLGCLIGFTLTAIVHVKMLPSGWYMPQPWTWKLLAPYVLGPAIGAIVIATTVRVAGGKVPVQVPLLSWLFIWLVGFLAFFTVDELGMRTQQYSESTLAFLCGARSYRP